MPRITHPRPQLGRQRDLGIEFIDGIAEVDELHPERALALVQHGFTIDETPELEERTVAELRAELSDLGYEVKKSWRKPELVERIAQHHELNVAKFVEGDGIQKTVVPVEGAVED